MTLATIRPTKPIDIDKVFCSYSGKRGCCCGCNGTYWYRENEKLRKIAGDRRGYPVSDEEVKETAVKRAVARFNRELANVEMHVDGGEFVTFVIETERRLHIIRALAV